MKFSSFRNIAENKFLLFSLFLTVLACAFQFWIAYPGWFNYDSVSLMENISEDMESVSMTYVFLGLFKLFGHHIWVALLLSIIPFYLGLWVLSLAFYKKYHSLWALLLFSPIFIQNIFVSNFILLNTTFLTNFSFLLYAIIFYYILNPAKHKNILLIILAVLMYILSIFVRHNGIIQVCFAPLIIIYLYLNNLNLPKKQFIFRYLILTIFAAAISVALTILPAKFLLDNNSHPAPHVVINQLAGMCVPAEDSSCFEDNWFVEGKIWQDLKMAYYKWPTNVNIWAYHKFDKRVIDISSIDAVEINQKYLYAIKKYPLNWIKHEGRLISDIWFSPVQHIEWQLEGSLKSPFYNTFNFCNNKIFANVFPEDELYLHETPLKLKLLHIWDDFLPKIPTMFWIILLSVYSLIFSFLLFFKKQKENTIVYSFILSSGGLFAALIYGGFYPQAAYRYMYPICVYGILATISYITFCIDCNLFKNIWKNIQQIFKFIFRN